MRFESQVCQTPMTPLATGIATMPATRRSSRPVSMEWLPGRGQASSSERRKNGGKIEIAAVPAISERSSARPAR